MNDLFCLIQSCFWLFLVLPLGVIAAVGLNLSLVLSLFQLQEGTLTFLVKITIFATLSCFLANHFLQKVSEIYNEIYFLIVHV